MERMLVILLVICLVIGGVIGWFAYRNHQAGPEPAEAAADPTEAPAASAEPAETAAPAEEQETYSPPEPDLDKLYATRDPEEIVLTVDGQDMSWGDYFYFLASQVNYVEEYFTTMAGYYGLELSWDDVAEGDTVTYAQLAMESVEAAVRQFATVEGFVRENGITLTEENREKIAQLMQSDIELTCGENGTEQDFAEFLMTRYLRRDLYDRINAVNVLYQESFRRLYGENGELLDEEKVLAFLEEGNYLSANHILLLTVDALSGETLDEETAAEKKETANRLAAELQAIEDPTQRLERFAELKEEYCEDTGKFLYPAGYTFTPGTMVAEFEDACKQLADYQVSDPVESSYGYHVLMKLPLDADALLFSSSSSPLTARATVANTEYGERLQAYMDGMELQYAEGFVVPDLLAYISE